MSSHCAEQRLPPSYCYLKWSGEVLQKSGDVDDHCTVGRAGFLQVRQGCLWTPATTTEQHIECLTNEQCPNNCTVHFIFEITLLMWKTPCKSMPSTVLKPLGVRFSTEHIKFPAALFTRKSIRPKCAATSSTGP